MTKYLKDITNWHAKLTYIQIVSLSCKTLLLGYLYSIIAVTGWLIISSFLGLKMNNVSSRTEQFDMNDGSFIFSVIAIILAEEVVFRLLPCIVIYITLEGMTDIGHEKRRNTMYLIIMVLSSIVFGWMHGGFIHILFQGILGLLWGALFIRVFTANGPLVATITTFTVHLASNSILFIFLYLNGVTRV